MFKALNYIVSNKGPRYRDINDIRGKVGKGGGEKGIVPRDLFPCLKRWLVDLYKRKRTGGKEL